MGNRLRQMHWSQEAYESAHNPGTSQCVASTQRLAVYGQLQQKPLSISAVSFVLFSALSLTERKVWHTHTAVLHNTTMAHPSGLKTIWCWILLTSIRVSKRLQALKEKEEGVNVWRSWHTCRFVGQPLWTELGHSQDAERISYLDLQQHVMVYLPSLCHHQLLQGWRIPSTFSLSRCQGAKKHCCLSCLLLQPEHR